MPNLLFTVYSLQFTVYGLQFTVYSLRFTVYGLTCKANHIGTLTFVRVCPGLDPGQALAHRHIGIMEWSFTYIIEILGTFSFAAAGAFAAMEKKLDPFGVLIISFATAIGGGTIRDVLIGELPVSWLSNTTAIWVILSAAIVTVFFGSYLKKLEKMLFLFDAMGLGLFTIIGIQTGITHGFSTGICIMLGTITGCFGGVLRDILLNNVPLIFQKEIYASASILGGILFFLMLKINMTDNLASVAGILIVFFVRVLAVQFNWSLPKFYEKNNIEKDKD